LTNTLTFIIVAMTTGKLETTNKTAGKKKVNMRVRQISSENTSNIVCPDIGIKHNIKMILLN